MRRLIAIGVFVFIFANFMYYSWDEGSLYGPPEAGDGVDYDAIALNISQGKGFGFDWDDPAYYEAYAGTPSYDALRTRHSEAGFYPTSYRPPAVPLLMGIVYKLTNRNFTAWRIFQIAWMSATVVLAGTIAAQMGGWLAVIFVGLFAVQSQQLFAYSHWFMTETGAAFMVTLFGWTWLRASRLGWTRRRAFVTGMVLGGLIATRSIFVLWTPVVLFVPRLAEATRFKSLVLPKALCLAGCLLVIGPWWVRNIVVTGARLPFGTEGALNLPAGFGPLAQKNRGVWTPNHGDGSDQVWARVKPDMRAFEVELARYRQRITLRWMQRHPWEVLDLMRLHVWQEIRPRGDPFADYVPYLGLLCAIWFRKTAAGRLILLMIAANLFGIAMTWSVEGRFLVPLVPMFLAVIGAAFAVVARRAIEEDDRRREA